MRMPYTTPPKQVGAYRVYQRHDYPDPIPASTDYEWWAWWDGSWGGTTGSPERAEKYHGIGGQVYDEHLDWFDPNPQTQPMEPSVNELLQALETIIRRIVIEEMTKPVPSTDGDEASFQARVRKACLDRPWFDGAIASEMANNQDDNIDALAKTLFDNGYFADKLHREINTLIGEARFTVSVA